MFIPTKKNAPAKDFFATHGFELVGNDGTTEHWELDLARGQPAAPPWIEIEVIQKETAE